MKSQQLEAATVKTSCKECVFALYNGKTQAGCELGRTDLFASRGKLIEAHDDFKEFNVVDGFCNYYRTKPWTANKNDCVAAVKFESLVSLGLVIYDEFNAISSLRRSVESIFKLDGDHRRVKVVISSFASRGAEFLVHQVNELKQKGFQAACVVNMNPFNIQSIDYDACSKCVGYSHLGKMESGAVINPDTINIINHSLNELAEKKVMFEQPGVVIMPFGVINREYTNYNDFQKMIDTIRPEAQQCNMYATI